MKKKLSLDAKLGFLLGALAISFINMPYCVSNCEGLAPRYHINQKEEKKNISKLVENSLYKVDQKQGPKY